jgi:hypothetical protein
VDPTFAVPELVGAALVNGPAETVTWAEVFDADE